MYNFDEIISRRGMGSLKWDTVEEGVIPLWVADMDFPCLPELRQVLTRRAEHPFYGYRSPLESYYEAVRFWYKTRHGLETDRDHILAGPGTVLSLGIIVREFSVEGEGVLILTPVYTPFFEVIRENRRKVVEVSLNRDSGGRFVLDIAEIERELDRAGGGGIRTPLALFCSPHNPGGRVWNREETAAFLEMAKRRKMIVASDEIHCDFVYNREKENGGTSAFVSAASLEDYADRVITVSGANKTFNLGGLHVSHFVIRNSGLRRIIEAALYREAAHQGDVFAELAVETVYRLGAPWLDELCAYLKESIGEAVRFLNAEAPGIRAVEPEGTYLIWADARTLTERTDCRNTAELARRLEKEGKVKITPGSIYGRGGEDCIRINAASPHPLLMEGLERIAEWAALNSHR
ncbi:MAG: aminotransferase class I/II-fold pyridoxal phosphate-dependent enzyme [Treponema sp.]|jgi:cystathionine beta-lyase|nr:aminotransferase class I/II-fold pyridoxal phosphate-dependent enzyme [Treponema sp.]